MMIPGFVAKTVQCCLTGFKKATAYLSPRLTVKACLRQKDRRTTEVVVTVGAPNFSERRFIKGCIKAGEPFPLRKILVKGRKK